VARTDLTGQIAAAAASLGERTSETAQQAQVANLEERIAELESEI